MKENIDTQEELAISVIVPVFNSSKYIKQTLCSIVGQSFNNYEIIVVNDGSTDTSSEIATSILEKSNRIYKIITQENKGLSSARNTGIKCAIGKYVCFVDSDDIIEETHLLSLFELVTQHNLKMAFSYFESTSESNRSGTLSILRKEKILDSEQFAIALINRTPPINICGILLQKCLIFQKNLFFNERLKFGEDAEYFLRLLFICDEVGLTNRDTYKYLDRYGSMMKSITSEQGEIFLSEIEKTYNAKIASLLKTCNGNLNFVDKLYHRDLLGFMRAFAKCTSYNQYTHMLEKVNTKELYSSLKDIDSVIIKIYTYILCYSHPSFSYTITKIWDCISKLKNKINM